jgi:hypothetical protein
MVDGGGGFGILPFLQPVLSRGNGGGPKKILEVSHRADFPPPGLRWAASTKSPRKI